MSSARVVDQAGVETGTVELPDAIFGIEPNEPVMHQALIRQLANGRQGTASTKTRSDVRGGGASRTARREPVARVRVPRAPRSGKAVASCSGRTRARSASTCRASSVASRSAARSRRRRRTVVCSCSRASSSKAPQTRAVADLIRGVDSPRKVLVVLGSHNEMFEKSARNIPEVRLTLAGNLSVRDIIGADKVIVTRDAIEHIEEAFA